MEVLDGEAIPAPLEAINFQIRIENLSRVALAQITRGRVGWVYVVTSQMPEEIDHNVTIPLNIVNSTYYARYCEIQDELESMYDQLVDDGIPPQDARYMTLHGQTTHLIFNVNYIALRGYFARRCENGLTDELNLVGRMIRHELKTKWALSTTIEGWDQLIGRLDAMGGGNVCKNVDKVFGNTGRAPSASDRVPSIDNMDNIPDWNFSLSAWYLELQHLPVELLLPGELTMIADWKEHGYEARIRKVNGTD